MLRCAGPIYHHRLSATNGTRGLRGPGFIPAVADCRYRAPLSPRLVRPCPTPPTASGRLNYRDIIHYFPERIKRKEKNLSKEGKKRLAFSEISGILFKCRRKRGRIWACSSAGRAFGSHPRGRGFKSLQVHQKVLIRTLSKARRRVRTFLLHYSIYQKKRRK